MKTDVILRHGEVIESVTPKENSRVCALVHAAIRRGELVRSAVCAWCGSSAHIEGHHPDYARPLMVIWLCRRCHRSHHKAHSIANLRGKRAPELIRPNF